MILAQSFLISDTSDSPQTLGGIAVLHSSTLCPSFKLLPPSVSLLMKAFFSLYPHSLSPWWLVPWGLWQLAMFTSGKMHFILLCLSSAVVAQDTPSLRRLPSEGAISPVCGFICLLYPQPSLYICLPMSTWWNRGQWSTWDGPDCTDGLCGLGRPPPLWFTIFHL